MSSKSATALTSGLGLYEMTVPPLRSVPIRNVQVSLAMNPTNPGEDYLTETGHPQAGFKRSLRAPL